MNDELIDMCFTAQELDVIYASLRTGPYQQVAPVIASIERQVKTYNAGLEPVPEPDDADEES